MCKEKHLAQGDQTHFCCFRAERIMKEAAQIQQSRDITETRAKGKENPTSIGDPKTNTGVTVPPLQNIRQISCKTAVTRVTLKSSRESPTIPRPVSKIPRISLKDFSTPKLHDDLCTKSIEELSFGKTVTVTTCQNRENL